MLRTLFACLVTLSSLQPALAQSDIFDPYPAQIDTAFSYLGTQEIGSNEGPEVSKFLKSVGLNPGYAWCAAYVSFCFDAADNTVLPKVRSARAQAFITNRSHDASDILRHKVRPKMGWVLVWKNGNGPYGHVGFVVSWHGRCGVTVEGNTSSGVYGSQREGDGIWLRVRCIEPANKFRITHFTETVYG